MDMDKIRVLSRPAPAAPAVLQGEEHQQPPPVTDDHDQEDWQPAAPPAQGDENQYQAIEEEEEREEGLRRSSRGKKQTQLCNPSQETQEQDTRRMSPRERKRIKAQAAKTATPRREGHCRRVGHRERNCKGSRDLPGMVRTRSGKRREAWRTEEHETEDPEGGEGPK